MTFDKTGVKTEKEVPKSADYSNYFEYDKQGKVIVAKTGYVDTCYYFYNANNDMVKSITSQGRKQIENITNTYDSLDRLITQYSDMYNQKMVYSYNKQGNINKITFTMGTGGNASQRSTIFEYNKDGFLKIAKRYYTHQNTPYETYAFSYFTDSVVCLKTYFLKEKSITDTIIDVYRNGLLKKETQTIALSDNKVTTMYTYNKKRLPTTIEESSAIGNRKKTTYQYNSRGLPKKATYEIMQSTIDESTKNTIYYKYEYY